MNSSKQMLMDYIKKHGKIISFDMSRIRTQTSVPIPEQMTLLKELAEENRIEEKTLNWWEPVFVTPGFTPAQLETAHDRRPYRAKDKQKLEPKNLNLGLALADMEAPKVDRMIEKDFHVRNEDIKEKIFNYLHRKNGKFDEVEFYVEYGVSPDSQKRCLDQLLSMRRIEPAKDGYKILKRKN